MTFPAAWERGRPGAQQGQLRLLGWGVVSPAHVPGALGAFASQLRGANHSAFCGGRLEFVLSLRTTGVITSLVLECENPDRADGPVEPEVPRGEEGGALQYSFKALLCAFTASRSYRWQQRHQHKAQLGRGAGPVRLPATGCGRVAGRLRSLLQTEFGAHRRLL